MIILIRKEMFIDFETTIKSFYIIIMFPFVVNVLLFLNNSSVTARFTTVFNVLSR